MEISLEDDPVDPELLLRLGKIVILGSQFESWLSLLLATLIKADLGGSNIVTNTLSVSAKIKCIRGLLSVRANEEAAATAKVTQLLDRADLIRTDRNELIHGEWNATGCEPKTALINTISLERAEIIRDRLITIPDLEELIAEIEEWIRDYVALGVENGFPRHNNSTKSIFLET
jgi:hypothetical protein